MLRDDIKDKVIEIIETLFDITVEEKDSFRELDFDAIDITEISEALITVFEIDEIKFATVMEWEKVSDIIGTVEEKIEYALHDMEK